MQEKVEQILKTTFGFQEFRPGQREAITALFDCDRLLCIQPTGHGKSLLYQLPACLLGGITLVISPLLALMRDQMHHLNERFHIPAAAINTDQTEEQNAQAKQDALAGKIKILFIAPEQLDHIDRFAFLLSLDIRLAVVDEAHCISTWGHDFRPSYRQILHFLSALNEKNGALKILGLTATANGRAEEDIKRQLTLAGKSVAVLRETMDRPNIRLQVFEQKGLAAKLSACADLLYSEQPGFVNLEGHHSGSDLKDREEERIASIRSTSDRLNLNRYDGPPNSQNLAARSIPLIEGCGLIYCATRENVELVAEFLQLQGIEAAAYHAGLEPEEKKRLQGEFLANRYKVLIATNALGMGIDKGNLRFVIHFDVPGSITAYYQEVGRSGRDGKSAQGILLFDPADRRVQEYFIEAAIPSFENFTQVLQAVGSAEKPPNLTAIKQITGLHPTRVTTIIAELLEQAFLTKTSQSGVQVYSRLDKQGMPDLSRYANQEKVKGEELQKMLDYGWQKRECRMALLRKALGDTSAKSCGHCDVCSPPQEVGKSDPRKAAQWLKERIFPIAPVALHKITAGFSLFDSKVSSPLFVRFMKERASISSYQEMEEELIHLLLKHFKTLLQQKAIGGIIPLPSRTWKAQRSILNLLSEQFHIPLCDWLQWKETPPQRQGELLNNDQRHHNVHQRMEANISSPPSGSLILFDDYIGSGNTLKEAGRALRAKKTVKNELVPFTIAAVKWHLGKPGFG